MPRVTRPSAVDAVLHLLGRSSGGQRDDMVSAMYAQHCMVPNADMFELRYLRPVGARRRD